MGFLAAPVSGNPHVVAEGGACIVASVPRPTFRAVRPYLSQIAKVAVHAGGGEQSRLVKLCHNLYLGMMVQALVEVTALAEKGGTDRAAFLEFLNGTVLGVGVGAQARPRIWSSWTGRRRSRPSLSARTSTWAWRRPASWRSRSRSARASTS